MTTEGKPVAADGAATVTDEQLRRAEAYVEAEEGATNRLAGWAGAIVTAIAVICTLFHLYAAYDIVATQPLRYTHVAFVMVLCFLLFPIAARFRNRIQVWDVLAAAATVAILGYALYGGDDFTDRATVPERLDVVLGVIFIVLLLEATRRTSGWIMPVVAFTFIAYAMTGPYLPPPWTHRGYDLKGKRVSTGSPGSATEVMAFRVMEASGLDKDRDMKRERLGAAESVNAIKDRKIDAFFWVGGLPTSAVTDLGATPGVKLKLIDHADAVAKMNAKYGNLYATSVIKAGTYRHPNAHVR